MLSKFGPPTSEFASTRIVFASTRKFELVVTVLQSDFTSLAHYGLCGQCTSTYGQVWLPSSTPNICSSQAVR